MELRQRWFAQAQLIRDEFSKHRCPGQKRRRLLEAAEKTVSPSFLCLGFVVSQSVIVSRTACLFCGAECVVCVVVVCVIKTIAQRKKKTNTLHYRPIIFYLKLFYGNCNETRKQCFISRWQRSELLMSKPR